MGEVSLIRAGYAHVDAVVLLPLPGIYGQGRRPALADERRRLAGPEQGRDNHPVQVGVFQLLGGLPGLLPAGLVQGEVRDASHKVFPVPGGLAVARHVNFHGITCLP